MRPQYFQKSRSYLKILGARRVTRNKFHTEYPQILRALVHNLVSRGLCIPALGLYKVKWTEKIDTNGAD